MCGGQMWQSNVHLVTSWILNRILQHLVHSIFIVLLWDWTYPICDIWLRCVMKEGDVLQTQAYLFESSQLFFDNQSAWAGRDRVVWATVDCIGWSVELPWRDSPCSGRRALWLRNLGSADLWARSHNGFVNALSGRHSFYDPITKSVALKLTVYQA